MIVTTPLLYDLASGNDRITPEIGDNTPRLGSVISPTLETILKTTQITSGTQGVADQSVIFSALSAVPASTAASTATFVTLPKGCYTIDVGFTARYVGASAANGATPDVYLDLVNSALTVATVLMGSYAAATNTQDRQFRRFRIVPTETVLIRRRTATTGVGQTIDVTWVLNVERHL